MGSLMDKINYLAATKEEIAKAITDKNVEIPAGTTFREYAGLISSISGGGGDGEEDEKYKLGVLTLTSENLEKKEYWARADGFYGYEYVDCTGLDGGGGGNLGTLSVTENGTYQASDEELDGYSAVVVNVPQETVNPDSKFTVTFKNWDGSVLQTVENVPLMGTATYTGSTPRPQNYDAADPYSSDQFIGWYPSPAPIRANTTCTAQFVPSEFYGPVESAEGYYKTVSGSLRFMSLSSVKPIQYSFEAENGKEYAFFIKRKKRFFGKDPNELGSVLVLCNDGTAYFPPMDTCFCGEITGNVAYNIIPDDPGVLLHQFTENPTAFWATLIEKPTDGNVITDSWEEICENHGAPYEIGSYKILYIPNFGHLKMQKVYSGEDVSTSTWLSMNCLRHVRITNGGNYLNYSGDWENRDYNLYVNYSGYLRTFLHDTVLPYFPELLRNSIVPVTKRTEIFGSDTEHTKITVGTIDTIWVPSISELCPEELYSKLQTTSALTYTPSLEFKHKHATYTNVFPYNSEVAGDRIKGISQSKSGIPYMTRTEKTYRTNYSFYYFKNDGGIDATSWTTAKPSNAGMQIGFCL